MLALHEQSLGNLRAVADIYSHILLQIPDCAVTHNNRGAVLLQLQRYDEAMASFDQAIKLKPDYANAHYNRGCTLRQLNQRDAALASYDRAIALKPDHFEAYKNRGAILQEMKRYDEALASYDQAIAIKPGHAEAYNNRGIVLANRGDMTAAGQMFLKAVELKPDFPDPLFNLVNIRQYRNAADADLKSVKKLLHQPGAATADQEQLYFALGKIYDDCGLYDEAFASYQRANRIRNARVSYDAQAVTNLTDGVIEVFNQDFLAQPFAFASESHAPIFIVGMPRSGTTLVASILSNHPSIASAGELPTITNFTARLLELTSSGVGYPQAARHLTADLATRLASDYEQELRRNCGWNVPYVIDKNPLNFVNLGFIAMLFPKARIIHCVRDPLDTCLSNYFQRFPLFLDYSFDLRNVGHFYLEYARLMNHWRTIPRLKLMDVSYEAMILNTEQTARQALDFIGLEWDERCLAPHTNPYAVENASQWQVRQPIYKHSMERWRHYEKHLAQLKGRLQSAGQLPN